MCRPTSYPTSSTPSSEAMLLQAAEPQSPMKDLLEAYDAMMAQEDALEEGGRIEEVMLAWR